MPAAPTALSARTPTATSVELTWGASTGGPSVERYLVLRNSAEVGSVAQTLTTYTDEGLTPDSTYRYTVVATSGSKRSDPSAELVVRTLPAAPLGLEVGGSTAGSMSITWDPPESGPAPENYVVLRDGSEVATVNGSLTSYEDTGLAPATEYRYRLVAVTGPGRSEESTELIVRTLPAAPTALKAGAATTSSIVVQWSPPAAGPTPESYVVLRNGTETARVPGTVRSYLDKGLAPATAYQYTVLTVSGGERSAPSAVLTARTFAPSVTTARLQGSWDVDGRITRASSGITLGTTAALGQTFSSTWTLTPKCTTGPCDAVVSGFLTGHPFSMTLLRSGGVYSGSTKVHISRCQGLVTDKDVINTLSLRLNVSKAGVSSSAWLASAWTGTLTLTSPYTSAGTSGLIRYYCPAGSLTASLAGSR